jgi:lipopolysaccharide export system protein LptC
LKNFRENIAVSGLFLVLFLVSIWLRFGLLEKPDELDSQLEKNDPDYYAENFTSTGVDETGKKYKLIADRLVHYPVGDRALLDNPHIIQYDLSGVPRHIYAESGWLYDNQSTILLTGNVRVVQSQTSSAGSAGTSEKMIIHLKKNRG